MPYIASIGTYLPCWGAPQHRVAGDDEDAITLAVEAGRAALIASVPGDEASVAIAIARHPSRLVGFFMLDPSAIDAVERARRALLEQGLRVLCLFPAMHGVPLHDERTLRVVEAAAAIPGAAVFVHALRPAGLDRLVGPPVFEQTIAFPGEVGLAAASMIVTGRRLASVR